jgi:endo-1,4-beta-xylanase
VLVINENNLESEGVDQKREVMLKLLTSLVRAGVPIDALGIQGHLPTDRRVDAAALDRFLTSVHDLGLKIVVTELDVSDVRLSSDRGSRDSAVAQTLTDFLTVVLHHPGLASVSVWGLSDKYSWYNNSKTPASLRREDGLPSRGALLDNDLRRKPSYFAVQAALVRAAHS